MARRDYQRAVASVWISEIKEGEVTTAEKSPAAIFAIISLNKPICLLMVPAIRKEKRTAMPAVKMTEIMNGIELILKTRQVKTAKRRNAATVLTLILLKNIPLSFVIHKQLLQQVII